MILEMEVKDHNVSIWGELYPVAEISSIKRAWSPRKRRGYIEEGSDGS